MTPDEQAAAEDLAEHDARSEDAARRAAAARPVRWWPYGQAEQAVVWEPYPVAGDGSGCCAGRTGPARAQAGPA